MAAINSLGVNIGSDKDSEQILEFASCAMEALVEQIRAIAVEDQRLDAQMQARAFGALYLAETAQAMVHTAISKHP